MTHRVAHFFSVPISLGHLLLQQSLLALNLSISWQPYPFSVQVVVIVPLQDLGHGVFIFEDDESKSSGSHAFMIIYDIGLCYFTEILEISFQDFL